MTKKIFIELAYRYTKNQELVAKCWNEIEEHYSKSNRFYHTLSHLADLYNQIVDLKDCIKDWDALLFSLFYHDMIYNSTKKNNEEKSAELAETRMLKLGVPLEIINKTKVQIIATKFHHKKEDSDTNFFTDADLSILGRDWNTYKTYCENIRKEYAIFPGFLYKKGRKKVIKHFLAMDSIFKTEEFYSKFESQAKDNLHTEFEAL